jgi:hypothetical protein
MIIFCQTKKGCELLDKDLKFSIRCISIHGDKYKNILIKIGVKKIEIMRCNSLKKEELIVWSQQMSLQEGLVMKFIYI